MVYINEVRERLHRACIAGMDAEYVDDVIALLDDHERLRDIDLEQFRVAVEAYKFEGECKRLEFCFGPEGDKQAAAAQIADGERLMALIDKQKGE